ncbi:uncharacterized protein [Diabrotica undecimpunctata]|uniref:uncharacterized protein n=1 Tax=Diabrotica undecimpunctata TaxID=50387 RepID=UPI003B63CB62
MKTESRIDDVSNINVNVTDIVLTPFACASIVNEVLKGVLYQKCQIPYPYNWMKNIVTKKREKSDIEINGRTNFKAEHHFRSVSKAFDVLEAVMTDIKDEFIHFNKSLKKVLFVLGTTPVTPSEVFTISVSSLIEGHNERNHINQLNKYQQKILRNIFLSQDWLDKIDASISCTNIYIYLIKDDKESDGDTEKYSTSFLPTAPLSFSSRTKHIQISLYSDVQPDENCCKNLAVFEDSSNSINLFNKVHSDKEQLENLTWYKYKDLVKGFKDCFINKKSVSEFW